jgi:chitinase
MQNEMMQRPFNFLHKLLLGAMAAAALILLCPHIYAAPHPIDHRRPHPLVVGYFPGWGQTYAQPFNVKALIVNRGAKLLDQINYSQASVAGGRCSLADRKSDLETVYTAENSVNGKPDSANSPFRGYFHQLKELKHRYPHLKIVISLEGAPAGFIQGAKPENRRAFVASCINTFLLGDFASGISEPGIFDGFDIDWESPQQNDAADFLALVAEFRRQMDALHPGFMLSIAVGDSPLMLPGSDFAALSTLVDQVGIMNYDYTGPWSPTTGFIAPLFSEPADPSHSNSIQQSIASYHARGVPLEKMLMGVPFYGYSWTAVGKTNDGLFQAGKGVHEDKPYHYIRALSTSSTIHRDPHTQEPWLFDGETFWTYEDPISVHYKVSYAAHKRLAGIMIWELSGDTTDAELLRVAHRSLKKPMNAGAIEKTAEESEPASVPLN